jgi:hypothetical protein
MNTRSFFLTLALLTAFLVTGCAGSGGIQGRVNIPVTSNGHMGSIQIGGQGSNSIYAPQQQSQQQQVSHNQQGHPGCQGGARPYWLSNGHPGCMMQPQQQQPQVVINNNNYQQPQYQQQVGQVGSQSCPCVVTQWGKACGNAAQSHQHNNPHMRLQCTR